MATARRGPVPIAPLAALAVFAAGAVAVRGAGVSGPERRCFAAVNRRSARGYRAVWLPMQLGSLAGPLAVGAALAATGRRDLGARAAAVGAATWVTAKAVKPLARRGRPAHAAVEVRVLGHEQAGLGYPSGHAAVAAATAAVVAPGLPASWRPAVWGVALAVGPLRSYVGAHLPLDVVGGVALGLAVGTWAAYRAGGGIGGAGVTGVTGVTGRA